MKDSLDILRTDGDSIEHHGVKGMKWGVRRYQNKDGTLTAAGKKRGQQFRTLKAVEYGLTDDEYDLWTNEKGSHKKRNSESYLRKTVNEYENPGLVLVAKNGSVVSANHYGPDNNGAWDIGWATAPSKRGKGITDKNIQEAIYEIRINRKNNERIRTQINPKNIPSIRAAERNGFVKTGLKWNVDGVIEDEYEYTGPLNKHKKGAN